MIEKVSGRVPPAAALLARIESSRALVPLLARPIVSPLLDAFAAYVVATEARITALEDRK